ncbi:MAG TPA: YggT family protein [Patescibacteria group bacterium]|nr:YggT family protein [Patescibacteria group bacterium]
MAQVYREYRGRAVRDPDMVVERTSDGMNIVARVVTLVGGVIMSLLAIRFLLSLLGANRANAFASFIYSVSHPFVAPFFGLFNYQEQIGIVRFEFETLIAILFWGFVTWMVARLLTLGNRVDREV